MYFFSNPMGVGHTKIVFQLSDFADSPSSILAGKWDLMHWVWDL